MSLESENAALRQRIEQLEAGLREARNRFETLRDATYGDGLGRVHLSDIAARGAQDIDALLAAQPPEEKENE